jgi:ATP-dependent protease ClpP protease subunit
MSIGEVFITGVIGNSYNQDGSVKEKGVELIDVVEQMSDLGEKEEYHFIINSQGGNVNVGKDIRDFIASVPNAKTVAKELCASIATVIHTAVPLQNRMIEEGTKYMIHNPWVEMSGDAATLAKVSKDLDNIEKDLEQHYAKATGSSKETISAFMAVETYLSTDQCIKLGFASQVIEKPTLRAVAKLQTNKKENMSTQGKSRLMQAVAVLQGTAVAVDQPTREAKAVMIETDQGTIETPYADVQVGDEVMIDGAPAPDGNYTIANGEFQAVDGMISEGTVIAVSEGEISSIEVVSVSEDAENKAELAALKAKLEASEAENSALKSENSQMKVEADAAAEVMEKLNLMESKAAMPTAQARFKKEPVKSGVTRGAMKERKASYKK